MQQVCQVGPIYMVFGYWENKEIIGIEPQMRRLLNHNKNNAFGTSYF